MLENKFWSWSVIDNYLLTNNIMSKNFNCYTILHQIYVLNPHLNPESSQVFDTQIL